MNLMDAWLLVKKIAVGIVITIVPLAIIVGGLWITRTHAGHPAPAKQTSSAKVTYAN
jgi:hypothetical protein